MADHRPLAAERALRIVAENKLLAAIDDGKFEDLPGFGKPSPIMDEPYDPYWWVRRKLKQEQIRINPRDGWLDHC